MNADTIIARCAKVAKEECEKFMNPMSAAMIAERITARSEEIKAERELVIDRLERDFGFYR